MVFKTETDEDSLLEGCGLGCISQVLCFFLGLLAAQWLQGKNARLADLVWMGWGFTQWIALVPIVLSQRRKGRPRTVQGLIITGSIGLLLSSACATIIFR